MHLLDVLGLSFFDFIGFILKKLTVSEVLAAVLLQNLPIVWPNGRRLPQTATQITSSDFLYCEMKRAFQFVAPEVNHQPRTDDSEAVASWRQRMASDQAKELYKQHVGIPECVHAQTLTQVCFKCPDAVW